MKRPTHGLTYPDWDFLFEMAAVFYGYFTTYDATLAGYSPQLIRHHVQAGKFERVHRGIYRLVHYPLRVELERYMIAWMWSNARGVLSHQTALGRHRLCDSDPSEEDELHLTVPPAWRTQRRRPPEGVILHYADVPPTDRTQRRTVPMTTPQRTLTDCIRDGLPVQMLVRALQLAEERGISLHAPSHSS